MSDDPSQLGSQFPARSFGVNSPGYSSVMPDAEGSNIMCGMKGVCGLTVQGLPNLPGIIVSAWIPFVAVELS